MNGDKKTDRAPEGKYTIVQPEKITVPDMKRVREIRSDTAAAVSAETGIEAGSESEKRRIAFGKTLTSLSQKMAKIKSEKRGLSIEAQRIGLQLRPYFKKGYQNLTKQELEEARKLATRLGELLKDE